MESGSGFNSDRRRPLICRFNKASGDAISLIKASTVLGLNGLPKKATRKVDDEADPGSDLSSRTQPTDLTSLYSHSESLPHRTSKAC